MHINILIVHTILRMFFFTNDIYHFNFLNISLTCRCLSLLSWDDTVVLNVPIWKSPTWKLRLWNNDNYFNVVKNNLPTKYDWFNINCLVKILKTNQSPSCSALIRLTISSSGKIFCYLIILRCWLPGEDCSLTQVTILITT